MLLTNGKLGLLSGRGSQLFGTAFANERMTSLINVKKSLLEESPIFNIE